MLRLVEEDWTARLHARLMEDACIVEPPAEEPVAETTRRDDGLTFGPYGFSPISGLHFDTPDDTAAS